MKSFPALVCLGLALLAPASFAAKEDKGPAVQATVLDHNEYPCENCLFGMSDYYVCFDANSKVLIGHEKVRTDMRKHAPTDLMAPGKAVSIHFNDKYIWVPQAKGKDLKLTQDYTKSIFLNSDRCKAAVH